MIDSNKIKITFGETVRELRRLKGITQEQLAEFVGLQPTTIASIETGRAFVSSEALSSLCNYFNVEPSFFFFNRVRILSEEDYDYIDDIKRALPSFSTSKLKVISNIIFALQR